MNTTEDIERPLGTSLRLELVAALLLVLMVAAIYTQVRAFDYITLDDTVYVLKPHVRDGLTLEGVRWALTATVNANWHPLTVLSFMAETELFGMDPGGRHVVNLLLHAATVVVLFLALSRATGAPLRSAMVAALVAVHPLNVESVAWVAERKGILSSFFWALTMLAYVRYAQRPSIARYALVALPFALGLMAKQMLVTLPLALLLLDYWPLRRIEPAPGERGFRARAGRLLLEKIPLLALSVLFSLVAYGTQAKSGAVNSAGSIPWDSRIVNALISTVAYISKALVPMRLSVHYPYDMTDALIRVGLAAFALVLVSATVLALAGRRRFLPVGWFWYLGTLVPVSQIIPLGRHSMADRYTYIPMIGLFILTVWGAAEVFETTRARRIAGRALAALVITSLAVAAHAQAATWRNSFAVYRQALEATDYDSRVLMMMGKSLQLGGQYNVAYTVLSRALSETPNDWETQKHMGLLLLDMGKPEDALAHIERARSLNPGEFSVLDAMGRALRAAGRYDEALGFHEEALSIRPDSAEVLNNIAAVYIEMGRCAEAREYLARSLREDPYLIAARKNMEFCPDDGAAGR